MSQFICDPCEPSRRDVLRIGSALAAAAPVALVASVEPASAQSGSQTEWRYCQKCHCLFYNGYPTSGICPAGGDHVAQGWNFLLDYDVSERNKDQQFRWFYCPQCFALTWVGDRTGKRGPCPGPMGYHDWTGFHFGLTYTNETKTTPPSGKYQTNWRFCGDCFSLFYDGYDDKGQCTAFGYKHGHRAIGWTFHLPYQETPAPKVKPPSGKAADRLNTAFNGWLRANKISNASLTVMQDGGIIGKFGHGTRTADTIVPVASLSKAITAVCISTLVDAGRLGFDDTIGTRLADFLKTHPPKDKNVHNITIRQLLKHKAGITMDPTQNKSYPDSASSWETIARDALASPLGSTDFFYNNVNYALLGIVIKQISGEAYETYCKRMIAGSGAPNARVAAGLQAMGPFGGWEMSGTEYAMFGRVFDKRQRMLSQATRTFLDSDTPTLGTGYTLGVGTYNTGSGFNYVHFGDWNGWNGSPTTPTNFGAYFVWWTNGISVLATYDKSVYAKTDNPQDKLDLMMFNAANGR
jgi:CubicO group peptidase (beta-lactamase class C family)